MPGIIVDIGTGDGKFVQKLAASNPDRFIIGIDPNHRQLVDTSHKLAQKPTKGGLPNCLFVLASIEALPPELNGLADQVFINFPWGSLLRQIILVDEQAWPGIARICKPCAVVDLLYRIDQQSDQNELNRLGISLDDLTNFATNQRFKLAGFGFRLVEARSIAPAELKNYPSSWAKKLAFGEQREYRFVRLVYESASL